MKQKITFFKVFLTLVLLCGVGNAWGDSYTLTPNNEVTESTSSSYQSILTFDYNQIGWSFQYLNPSTLQIKTNEGTTTNEFNFKNTSAFPGRITKVVITFSALTVSDARKLCFVGGTSTISSLSGGTAGTWNSTAKTLTWTPSETDEFTYFAFYQNGKAASGTNKLATTNAIVVTYESASDNRIPVNITDFTATSTALIKGNTTTTSVTNDQTGWHAAYNYSSNKESVATVNESGVITAVGKGSATITATLNVASDDAAYKKGKTTSKAITITVNNPTHTAEFSINGSINEADNKSVEEGELVTFPSNPSVEDVEFIGWTTTAIHGIQDNKPALVTTSTETMGTSDVTYYAVFAAAEESNNIVWREITTVPQVGTYAICSDTYFMKASISSNRFENADQSPSINEDGTLDCAPSEDCIWEINKPDDYYRIKNGSNYAGGTGTKNQGALLTDVSSDLAKWSIGISDDKFEIINYGRSQASSDFNNKYLRNNDNNGWATYASGTGNAPRLFMKTNGVSYSDYCTTVVPLKKHKLTITEVNNGTLTVKKGNTTLANEAQVAEGAVITLTAAPAEHYHFDAWTGDVEVSETEGVYSFTMPTSDATIGVTFEEDTKYHITANVPDGGTYTVKVGDADAVPIDGENEGFDTYAGTKITMTSTADDTHQLQSTPFVVEDAKVSKSGDSYSFTMPNNAVTITAKYTETYPISIADNILNGTVTADKSRVSSNSDVTLTLTPEAGYKYKESSLVVSVNGSTETKALTEVNAGKSYKFTMSKPGVTVYAEFEPIMNNVILVDRGLEIASIPVQVTQSISAAIEDIQPLGVDDNEFFGWCKSESTDNPVKLGDAETMGEEDIRLYAVYCKVTGEPEVWTLVTDASTLNASDQLVIACSAKSTTAGNISNEVMASIGSTFATEGKTITSLGTGTQILTLGGNSGAWTLANSDGELLGATAAKKLTWDGGATTWSISISSNGATATIQNGTSSNGRFLYNANSGQERFTTYMSDASASMLLPQLYVKKGGTTTTYTLGKSDRTYPVEISKVGYATAYIPFNAIISNEANDVKAYYVTVLGNNAQLNEIEGTIPANTGVVLKGSAGTVTFTESAGNLANVEGNLLIGTTNAAGETFNNSEYTYYTYYILSTDEYGKNVGFYWDPYSNDGDAANCAQYKAVLAVSGSTAPSFFTFDDATAINAISNVKTRSVRYNLNGQAVGEDYKGIVIVNGKKMFNK